MMSPNPSRVHHGAAAGSVWVVLGLLVGACAALLGACASSTQAPALRRVHIKVQSDDGQPLAGVAVDARDQKRGSTDARGELVLELAVQGLRTRLQTSCPEGFHPAPVRSVDLRAGSTDTPLFVSVSCRPRLRTLGIVVYAPGGEGHAVTVDGVAVGEVASDATFHTVLKRPPETRVRVSLDPGSAAFSGAQRDVMLADRDELVLLEPRPIAASPAKPRRAHVQRGVKLAAAPAVYIPQALSRARH